MCPNLSFVSASLVKIMESNHSVSFNTLPLRQFLLSFNLSMYIIYPDNKMFILLWFVYQLKGLPYAFHLLTLNLQWWRITESNRWPPACKAGALASWANPPEYQFWVRSFEFGALTPISQLFSPNLNGSPVQIWTGDPYIISVVL
jgi:hypothetical protein